MQGPLKLSYFFLIFHVIVTIRIYISILITSTFISFIYARGFARFCFLSIIFLYRKPNTAFIELKPLCP